MRNLLCFLLVFAFCQSLFGQTAIAKLNSLRFKGGVYEFLDPDTKKLYSHGWIEQRYAYPVFRTVAVDKHRQEIVIEAILADGGNPADTLEYGFCCSDVLVGRVNAKGRLYNVRRLGESLLRSDSLNPSGRDGFFAIRFKFYRNDILIIGNPGRAGAGSVAYSVGKLLD